MGLASDMEIPLKAAPEKSDWSFRRLFPLKATVSSITKSFTNPFDIILVFLVLIIGFSELIGTHISWMLYALTFFVLVANVIERQKVPPIINKEVKKKE